MDDFIAYNRKKELQEVFQSKRSLKKSPSIPWINPDKKDERTLLSTLLLDSHIQTKWSAWMREVEARP